MWKFPFRLVRRRSGAVLPDAVPGAQIPAMITPDESVFYEECAKSSTGKPGAIVDLGCWLGGTSIALARGILNADGERQSEKVLGFDLFRWEQWMPAEVPYCRYQLGDSFLPEARRLTHDHGGDKVELIQADLTTYNWMGGPIKILLVDAMKTEALARQIAQSFYPSLSPGALLIHQDFKHFHTTWIHLLHYELRDYFQVSRVVRNGTSVAFEARKTIPLEAAQRATDFGKLSDDQIDECFCHSIDLVGPDDCVNVAAAHVMHYLHLGRRDRAFVALERYREMGMKGDLVVVVKRLERVKSKIAG
jgi:hypothetical protein